jgi:hypothetical protein
MWARSYRLYREEGLGAAKSTHERAYCFGAQPAETAGGSTESGLESGLRG